MDTLTADTLAASLQESKKALLAKVLRTLGQERCQAIFTEACAIEASGGMLTSAGDRRRTAGGTFSAWYGSSAASKNASGSFRTRPRRSSAAAPATAV